MTDERVCAQCGAKWQEGGSCQTAYEELLALEYSDRRYGIVHFLTVTCYMIQHEGYSDPALARMHEGLRAFLEEGVQIEEIRRKIQDSLGQSKRDWKIGRQPDERKLPTIDWSCTVADAYAGRRDAGAYHAAVERWAHATLKEMGPLLQGN